MKVIVMKIFVMKIMAVVCILFPLFTPIANAASTEHPRQKSVGLRFNRFNRQDLGEECPPIYELDAI